jgi:hypothetical protein
MKWIVILGLAAALSLPVATAAAPPPDVMAAQINILKKQVSGLTLQVSSLRSQVARLSTDLDAARATTRQVAALSGCVNALMVDGFHITWRVIDAITTALGAGAVFGPQTPLDDQGTCAAAGITRTPQATARLWRAAPLQSLFARLVASR